MSASKPLCAPLIRAYAPRCSRCPTFPPSYQVRMASQGTTASKYKRKDGSVQKKKKGNTSFELPDLKLAEQFSLIDAMRYIRAFEVGVAPTSAKYDLALRMRTMKNGPVLRNRMRLPHPVDTSARICVICVPGSKAAKDATAAGATLVGDEEVFAAVKDGRIEFDRCICHADSLQSLTKAGLGRILGPRGLMPSVKLGTVVKDVASTVRGMVGGSEYRERLGVIRMSIGQLGFTPEEVQRNIRAFMEQLQKDIAQLSDGVAKEVHEVVLSSTQSPGFSLNGNFKSAESLPSSAFSTL